MLETGTKAPAFELPDQNGVMHRLEDYKGKKVILYFYPKDNTPGCTKQACGYSERYPQFMEKGAVILGVSKDSVASHKRFEEKYGLAFTLLSDPERTATPLTSIHRLPPSSLKEMWSTRNSSKISIKKAPGSGCPCGAFVPERSSFL